MAAAPAGGVSQASGPSKHKIVFVGDSRTGKTSVTKRFIYDTFDAHCHMTVGIDFLSKLLDLEDRTVRLQLWDTAGQERFRSLIPSYIRDSSGAVVVYDLTDRASFDNASRWIQQVREERGEEIVLALVGNKLDLEDARQVSVEDGRAKAEEAGALFAETSAKTGEAVKELFKQLASALPRGQPARTTAGVIAGGAPGGFNLNPPKPNKVKADRNCAC